MPVLFQTTLLLICTNIFVPFTVLYMERPLKLDFLWAALCICAAVYFVRSSFVHSSAHCSHASSQTSHISSAIAESYSRSATHARHVAMQVKQVVSQPERPQPDRLFGSGAFQGRQVIPLRNP
jgi:hypothetical protein